MIDLDTAVLMRSEGATFEEIGRHFGVTRQCVCQYLQRHCHTRRESALVDSIPYKGIYAYLMAHPKMTIPIFTYAVLGSKDKAAQGKIRRFLTGSPGVMLPKRAYDALIRMTGLGYEELFAEREVSK